MCATSSAFSFTIHTIPIKFYLSETEHTYTCNYNKWAVSNYKLNIE